MNSEGKKANVANVAKQANGSDGAGQQASKKAPGMMMGDERKQASTWEREREREVFDACRA